MTESFAALPWAYVLCAVAIGGLLALSRFAPASLARMALGRDEVLLLALGAAAGSAVNLPVFEMGGAFLALNLGGAILAIVLAHHWFMQGKMRPWKAAFGAALVAVATHSVVVFVPAVGIVAPYPGLFLPLLVAFAYAVLVSIPRLDEAPALAFTSGSLGAFMGADVWNLGVMRTHFEGTGDLVIVSLGGAGALDMVFLAGAVPLVLCVLLALPFMRPRRPASPAPMVTPAATPTLAAPEAAPPHAAAAWAKPARAAGGGALPDAAPIPASDAAPIAVSWGDSSNTTSTRVPATLPSRVIALGFDLALVALVATGLTATLLATGVFNPPALSVGGVLDQGATSLWLAFTFAGPIAVLYFTLFETVSGRTPGKALAGIEVVCIEDPRAHPTLLRAFLRNLLRFLWIAPAPWLGYGAVAALVALDLVLMSGSERGARAGDLAARTMVARA